MQTSSGDCLEPKNLDWTKTASLPQKKITGVLHVDVFNQSIRLDERVAAVDSWFSEAFTQSSRHEGKVRRKVQVDYALGPIHTGCGAPCNTCMQIMEHTAVNGSVHIACKQHQRACMQIYLGVQCERGRTPTQSIRFNILKTIVCLCCAFGTEKPNISPKSNHQCTSHITKRSHFSSSGPESTVQ